MDALVQECVCVRGKSMKNSSTAFKAVILAGGSGERFWPLSTDENPKQFLRVFGGESLIRQCAQRLKSVAGEKEVFVVTSKRLVAATRSELPELPLTNIVGEPMRRDTAAAVALGVSLVAPGEESASSDPVIGFFSSDQMVLNPTKFIKTLKKAISTARRSEAVVTIGIKPTFPSPAFGYINPSNGVFVEKPSSKKAANYLKKGYLWNAGMFIARASVFKRAFAQFAPELYPLSIKPFSPAARKRFYEKLPKISFDYAVMEKYGNVKVVKGDFGWDDVGSYGAFDKYFPHDAMGNVREGPCTVVESEGNICVARSARISLLGVKNLVVVTTPNAVLVADKSRVSEMKKLVGSMK